jgi:hypothetical protein
MLAAIRRWDEPSVKSPDDVAERLNLLLPRSILCGSQLYL